jgi:hypothetical protein
MLRFDAVPEPVAALLGQLASHQALEPFALGGGTSLALRFGHRLSVDLDYPHTDPFAVIRRLVWFEEAEQEADPVPLAGQNWDGIKQIVTEAVAEL